MRFSLVHLLLIILLINHGLLFLIPYSLLKVLLLSCPISSISFQLLLLVFLYHANRSVLQRKRNPLLFRKHTHATCMLPSNSTRFYLIVGDLEISGVLNWLGRDSYMQFFISSVSLDSTHRRLSVSDDDRARRRTS
jgi:hypothetical protein